ncbi:MAG: adenosylcobinamide-GDP ribazoletransferase [Thermacetogeniaceae bacterium]|jgi:adenosylcobinamide-GDP ribazoletransferase
MLLVRSFLCALAFLTRIPVPGGWSRFDENDFRRSGYWFPLIGLLLGVIIGLLWYLLRGFLAAPVLAALLLGLSVFLTGGLHLDGLMDTVDGVYGGRSREERLAFMKDSHVGAFGVIAVVLILILKYSLYAQINFNLLPYLLAAPVLGRQAMVWAQVVFPYARKQGLGSLFSIYGNYKILMITTGISLFLLVALLKLTGVGIFVAAGLFFYLTAGWLSRLLGGLTGDTYGALCELTEIVVLLIGVLLGGRFQ